MFENRYNEQTSKHIGLSVENPFQKSYKFILGWFTLNNLRVN